MTDSKLEVDVPPPEEQDSYFTQDYVTSMLIDAMESIGQTCARSGQYGPNGHHEIVAIRTDHIGSLRRAGVKALMRLIECLSRPAPRPVGKFQLAGRAVREIFRGYSVGQRLFNIGYKGLCLPRWFRKIIVRTGWHEAWREGYGYTASEDGKCGVCDRDWYQFRKSGVVRPDSNIFRIVAVFIWPFDGWKY
jgi:hypothetical protein